MKTPSFLFAFLVALWATIGAAQPAPDPSTPPALSAVAGQTFRYCHNPVWRPFDYSDEGRHRGIFRDYLELFAARMNITVVAHPTPTWTGALEGLRRGDCDFLVGAVRTPEREQFSLFTTPYYDIDYVVIAKQDKPFTTSLDRLNGQAIGAAKNSAMMAHLVRNYPRIRAVPMETGEEVSRALLSGQIYGAIGALDEVASDQNVLVNNFKVIHKLDYPYSVSVAVRKDLPQLHEAFEWAVNSLTSEDRIQISRRWTPIAITERVDYRLLLQVLGVGGLLLASFVIWNRRLQKEIRKRRIIEAQLHERSLELEALTQRLRISLKAGQLSAWEWLSSGESRWSDDTLLNTLGYGRDDAPRTYETFLSLVHPDDVPMIRKAHADYIAGLTDSYELEFRIRANNGQWHWLRAGGIAMERDEAGRATHLVGVQFDITAQRQAQDAKQAFISMVSHELRTPINAVTGMGKRLLRTPLDDRQRDYVTKIDQAAALLLRVINDILDFSQLEAGKMPVVHEPFELKDVLSRVKDIVGVATEAQGLSLQLEVAPDVPLNLIGDGMRIEQILINLASNAVKFTEHGEIRIAVRSRRLDTARCELEFSVHDTGIGIEPNDLRRLFKPFTQVDPFLTRRHGGTGLGLAISQQLVELMNGKIWAHSEPGRGSTFSFALPLEFGVVSAAARGEGVDGASQKPPERLRHLHVLLVEDNAFNRQLVVETLADAGIAVDTATNGLEALRQIKTRRPDVVLMDIQMEVMDGLEATTLIRAIPGMEDLPIIAMTAHGMLEMRNEATNAGLSDFLLKPVEPDELYAALLRATAAGAEATSNPRRQTVPDWGSQTIDGLDMTRALRMTRGQFDLLLIRLRQFIAELGDSGEQMQQLEEAGRWQEAGRMAHSLKGAAGNIGAMTLSALADRFLREDEHAARSQLAERIAAELVKLRKQCERLSSESLA